ncbi:glycosyltransferase family 4 protein [Escherichia albertii]|nr:glycosyltransferase family 4 protein [Escherichia albertii]MCZ9114888.1 glycosyltransferase family 4 protein [Escherichia albertii]MCZ9194919.1 glycosyltransferase family 4 protein [Escherichia albertii]MCZ9214644.1 glycosyltransferase family 4 protein [Escherichia albertii]MCZ9223677.1 glycosyltransferase family 4 protein [Escherichia albertii]
MKNICFVNSYACLGGAERSLQALIEGFIAKDYSVHVIIGESRGPLLDWLRERKIRFKIIKQPSLKKKFGMVLFPFYLLQFLFLFYVYVKKNKIEIIHTNTFRARIYCALAKYITTCKLICHVRDIEYSRFNKALLRIYDYTIAISDAVKRTVLEGIKGNNKLQKKIITIHNGVKVCHVPQTENKKYNDYINIGMFARFDEWKCHHVLIEAADILKKNNVEMKLGKKINYYLYGDAIRESEDIYYSQIKKMVHNLQLENDVFFMGFYNEPINEMHKMNIIVCPSDNEPFGRVLIEAMAIKKIVIASNNGGVKDILGRKFSDLTFEPRNAEALARKIEMYVENQNEFECLYCDLLHKEYRERFSLEALLDNIEQLYLKDIK